MILDGGLHSGPPCIMSCHF